MTAELELQGFEAMQHMLENMPELSLVAGEVAMNEALLYLLNSLPPYPDKPEAGLAARLWSPKQRAAFFMALKERQAQGFTGGRTGELGQMFTTETRRVEGAVEGEIGTADAKAPWVVGPDYPGEEISGQTMYQARIHEGRWWQFYDVIERGYPEAMRIFQERFWAEIEKAWRGA